MALPISVTYTFATATSAIPLSQLDSNFSTVVNGINGIGNGTNALSNVSITGGAIDGTTIGATTSSTGRFSTVTATTGNITTINATTTNSATVRADGNLTFQSNGTTTAMTIDTSQNVGIGTSSPSQKLTIKQAGDTTLANQGIGILASGSDTQLSMGYRSDLGGIVLSATYVSTGSYQPMLFRTSDTERMRIDTSGNVGIGTSSPTFTTAGGLHINKPSDNTVDIHLTNSTTGSTATDGFDILLSGLDALLVQREAASMQFYTSATESARIDSSGNLLVGTTSLGGSGGVTILPNYQGANTPGAVITNKTASGTYNAYLFRHNGGNVGSITYSDTATSYNTSSDYRLKHTVVPLTNGIATVSALKPVSYKWNADDSDGEGFIAHELQEVIPLAVTGEKDAVNDDGSIKPQGVDYSKIVVHLVAAIQELKAEIDALKGAK